MFNNFFSRQKTIVPEWWTTYLGQVRSMPHLGLPPRAHRFVILDTETSGLEPDADALLSIAAYGISRNMLNVEDHFSCIIRQVLPADPENISIHGIMPEKNREGLPEAEALQAFLAYCGNAILVGHHLGFDLKFLNNALRKIIPGATIKNKSIDIINLTLKLDRYPNPAFVPHEAYRLDNLCKRFDISPIERHTADGDAWVTAILFLKLLNKISRAGWNKTRHLIR